MPEYNCLSPEQEAILPALREEWLKVGLSTRPADREAAERGIRMTYKASGMEPPPVILWFNSSLAGCAAAALLDVGHLRPQDLAMMGIVGWKVITARLRDLALQRLEILVREQAGPQAWEQVQGEIWTEPRDSSKMAFWKQMQTPVRIPFSELACAPVRKQLCESLDIELGLRIHIPVWEANWHGGAGNHVSAIDHVFKNPAWSCAAYPLEAEVRSGLGIQVQDQTWHSAWLKVGEQLKGSLNGRRYGQHDAAWLCFYDALGRYGVSLLKTYDGLALAARSCGNWWSFPGIAICTERPEQLLRDDQGMLHCSQGMALRYPDGSGLWRLHGVQLNERIVMRPETYTPQEIMEEWNSEVRRIILDRFGYERFMRELGARPVDRDRYGTLYRVEFAGEEPLVMVHVVNSTREPDGTRREFFLRVPPYIRRAREAVAWTFGMQPGEYKPARQS